MIEPMQPYQDRAVAINLVPIIGHLSPSTMHRLGLR
ncbi:uncharacterized protein METZ01_LOCUS152349 [marine metagenome]|uniref:Uncharacterized protein n=1 Tax=marine metagenome TaxID=408172 RepID=A0A382AD66_9ZZZZ